MRGFIALVVLLVVAGGAFYWLTLGESSTGVVITTPTDAPASDGTLPKPGPVDPIESSDGVVGASKYAGERDESEPLAADAPLGKGSLVGRVVGEDGKPISKAIIEARNNWGGPGATNRLPKPIESDVDGKFLLRGLPLHTSFDVEVSHLNYVTQTLNVVIPEDQPFKLAPVVMKPGAVLTGIVFGPDGKAMPKAAVTVRQAMDETSGTTMFIGPRGFRGGISGKPVQTDGAGRWTVGGLEAGRHRINAVSTECVRSEDVFAVSDLKAPVEAPAIALTLGKTITGRVLDAEGRAVAGAMVTAGVVTKRTREPGVLVSTITFDSFPMESGGRVARSTTTGPDGVFKITGIVDGTYKLTPSAPGHVGKPLEVTAGAADVIVKVDRGGMAAGLLVDADGKPVLDAKISPTKSDMWRMPHESSVGPIQILRGAEASKASGLPMAPNLIALVIGSGDISVDVVADRCGQTVFNVTGLTAGEVRNMEFKMLAECSIDGMVVDDSGAPIPGVSVVLRPKGSDDGTFRSIGGRTGDLTASVVSVRRSTRSPTTSPTFGAIAKSQSGDDGRFKLSGFPDGTWEVHATLDGYLPETTDVTVEARSRSELKFILTRGGKITGRVLMPDGTPVAGKTVVREDDTPEDDPTDALRGRRFGPSSDDIRAVTDAEGRYVFTDVKPGKYRLVLEQRESGFVMHSSGSGSPEPPRGVAVTVVGSETVTADLRIPKPGRVSGVVVEAGVPIAGIRVELNQNGPSSIFGLSGNSVVTDDRGRFQFNDLEPGTWSVSCRPKNAPESVVVEAVVEEGAEIAVTIKLPGGVIEGFVRDSAGAPIVGARVVAARNGGEMRSGSMISMAMSTSADESPEITTFDSTNPVFTGADGSYRIPYMADGPWNVKMTSKGHQPVVKDPINVTDGQVTRVDFTTEAGGSVEFNIDGESRFRFVHLTPKDSKQPTPEPASGGFGKPILVRGLTPGVYTYSIDGNMPELEARGEFTVRAGETTRVNTSLKAK